MRDRWRRLPTSRSWDGALTVLLGVGAAALGVRGFLLLPARGGVELGWGQALYRTARLFTLNLDVPEGLHPGANLWVASVLAPLTTLRVLLVLLRERVRGLAVRHLLRDHAVVCGIGARGSLLVRQYAANGGLVVAVDLDGDRASEEDLDYVIGVGGDATLEVVLRRAGVARAATLVAITGDDYVNAAIASAAQRFAQRDLEVFVHLDEPGLARIIETTTDSSSRRVSLVPFSTTALAAVAAIDELAPGTDAVVPTHGQRSSLVLFGDDPMVDALVLELHRRWQVARLEGQPHRLRPLVTTFGERANDRAGLLRRRFGPALDDMELAAYDVDRVAGTRVDDVLGRLLQNAAPTRHLWVVDRSELAGLRLAVAVSRAVGPDARVLLLSNAPVDVLTRDIASRTQADGAAANVEPRSIVGLAARVDTLQDNRRGARLARAVHGPEASPEQVSALEDLLSDLASVEDDPAPVIVPTEGRVLAALGLPSAEAFVRAGLHVDVDNVTELERAGPRLLGDAAAGPEAERGQLAAFAFEYYARVARMIDRSLVLEKLLSALDPAEPAAEDVRALLQLRIKALELRATPVAHGPPEYALVAGGAASWTIERQNRARELLAQAVAGWAGTLISGGTKVGAPGAVGDVLGVTKMAFVPRTDRGAPVILHDGYDGTVNVGDRDHFSVNESLRAWTALLAAGSDPRVVPLVVFPGGTVTQQELALGRALGAPVALVDLEGEGIPSMVADEIDLRGVLVLPDDGMALKEALQRPGSPSPIKSSFADLPSRAHAQYVISQAGIKPPDDPAMRPWSRLAPALRSSNVDQARHISVKLAALGLEAVPAADGTPLTLDLPRGYKSTTQLPGPLEELAKMEHGRWIVERRRAGWSLGARVPSRLVSPHLIGWNDLDDLTKSWDRNVILELPAALKAAGLGVRPIAEDARIATTRARS